MHVRMVFAALAIGPGTSAAARADVIISNFPGNDSGRFISQRPLGRLVARAGAGQQGGRIHDAAGQHFHFGLDSTPIDHFQYR